MSLQLICLMCSLDWGSVFYGGRPPSPIFMTSNQGYILSNDLSLLMWTLITWLRVLGRSLHWGSFPSPPSHIVLLGLKEWCYVLSLRMTCRKCFKFFTDVFLLFKPSFVSVWTHGYFMLWVVIQSYFILWLWHAHCCGIFKFSLRSDIVRMLQTYFVHFLPQS